MSDPQRKRPPRRWFRFSLRTLLIVVMVAAGLAGVWHVVIEPYLARNDPWAARKPGDPLVQPLGEHASPEQKALFDLCAKLKVGMKEQDVDAIMSGYSSGREDPQGFPRGSYLKDYKPKRERGEYDP